MLNVAWYTIRGNCCWYIHTEFVITPPLVEFPVPISAFTNVHNSKLPHLHGNLLSVEVFVVVCNEHTSYNIVYCSKYVSIILIRLRYKIAILLHAWHFSGSIVCCVLQLLINSMQDDEYLQLYEPV